MVFAYRSILEREVSGSGGCSVAKGANDAHDEIRVWMALCQIYELGYVELRGGVKEIVFRENSDRLQLFVGRRRRWKSRRFKGICDGRDTFEASNVAMTDDIVLFILRDDSCII